MNLELLTQIPAANDESMYRYIILGNLSQNILWISVAWNRIYIYIEREI